MFPPPNNPNESEVKIPTLEAKPAALEAKNNAAKTAAAELGKMTNARDAVLYDPETGIVKLLQLVKKYLDRVLGKDSAGYRQINASSLGKSDKKRQGEERTEKPSSDFSVHSLPCPPDSAVPSGDKIIVSPPNKL